MANNERLTPADLVFEKNARLARLTMPLYLLVPILFWFVFHTNGAALQWSAFGLGALGWFIALLLRGPLSALVIKWPKQGKVLLISSSGPLEEGVRYTILAFSAINLEWTLSLGQGWAAIEVVYVIINTALIASLAKRTDEKAMQAKELLKAQGTLEANPIWGLVERLSASAFHIGATLCIAALPWTVLILIPLHSAFNLAMVWLVKKSVAQAELIAALIGGALLGIGLMLL